MFGRPEPQCSAVWTSVLPQLLQQKIESSTWCSFRNISWASVSLGATAGASCKGWMFLLANSSIVNGNFQSFSSPTGILLMSAFLSLSSKSLARNLKSKPQGIEESHVDISLCMTRSCLQQNGQEQLSNAAFNTAARASAWQIPNSASVNQNSLFSLRQIGASSVPVTQVECF